MKILYFIENLGSGGKERRLVELIKKISQYPDVSVEIALMKDEIHYKDIHNYDVKIHLLERKGLKKDPRIFFKFFRLVRKVQPNIIHVWGNMVAIYSIPARILLGGTLINSQITDAPEKPSTAFLGPRLTFPFSDRIIANSHAGLNVYNAPSEKSSVIYNGFDFSRLDRLTPASEIRSRLALKTTFIVGMVATFYHRKDYSTYIAGAQLVLEKNPDVTFLCIGAGDSGPYEGLVESKWRNNIKFLGKQSDVESIMNVCDVGVLTTHGEGISNALLEFSALSKPIVATDAGGTSEIIEDGANGYLLKQESPQQLKDVLLKLFDEKTHRVYLGENGRQKVKNMFSIDNMITSFYKEYETLSGLN